MRFSDLERKITSNRILEILFRPMLYLADLYRIQMLHMPKKDRVTWKLRTKDVLSCPDLKKIPRHADAGRIAHGAITMHNGIRVQKTSYYGYAILQMLVKSRGVHEPQEELVFAEMLKTMPNNALMIELGSYWSFYSIWFNKMVNGARNFLVEPTDLGIDAGKLNFNLNNVKGTFIRSYVDKQSYINENNERFVCVDDLIEEFHIEFVDVLHADIQSYEYEMLKGSTKLFKSKKIGYIFISTHSDELPSKCLEFLREKKFIIIADVDLANTYSFDGLLVARSPEYPGLGEMKVSLKKRSSPLNSSITSLILCQLRIG